MSCVAGRKTTVGEDRAYCLLGIFSVFLPLIHGEGEKYPLQRLREEIQRRLGRVQSSDITSVQKICSMLYTTPLAIVQLTKRSFIATTVSKKRILCRTRRPPPGPRREALPVIFTSTYVYLWAGRWREDGGGSRTRISDDSKASSNLSSLDTTISRETFEIAYREIGTLLRIPGITDDNANVKQLVKDWLDAGGFGDWLMIIDNADDPSVLLATVERHCTWRRKMDM
jgi:hypothetical protein